MPTTKFYIPFYYSEKAKFRKGYVLNQKFLSDLPVVLLSVTLFNQPTIYSIVATLVFFIAFNCVYEIGYYENDFVGANFETCPRLKEGFESYQTYPIVPGAWIWAVSLSVLGTGVLFLHDLTISGANEGTVDHMNWVKLFATWIVFLLGLRFLFWIYNTRVTVATRQFIYPGLQIAKYFGFMILMPATTIGIAFMVAHVLRRWINYLIYRCQGTNSLYQSHRTELILFTILSLAFVNGFEKLNLQFWVISVWLIFRGYREYSLPQLKNTNNSHLN